MPENGAHPTDKYVGSRVRMRRLMLGLSQTKLGDALGLTFQQVQKYEKGTNRVSASRLQQISEILQVEIPFFFEGSPHMGGQHHAQNSAPSPQYVSDYLATSDGLHLTKAFMQIPNAQLRRTIVNLVESIAGHEENDGGPA
jgi:transcriptional regulator with XRE-family HTH domain